MLDSGKLEQVLKALDLQEAEIKSTRQGMNLIAQVISPSFEGQDDGERQAMVWTHLHERLTPEELVQVEFVFTITPKEQSELG